MLTIKVGHAYTTNVTKKLNRGVNMMGYGYEKHDDECKKCYDYSYEKYYMKKCYCKCCFEPYYPKDDSYKSGYDHKSDYGYDYKSSYDHKSDYGYDYKSGYDHKSDYNCGCKKRYY